MISDPVLELIESGAIAEEGGAPDRAPITTGLALGTQRLYEAVRSQPLICFAPVSHTHAIGTLGGIERLVAINSVLEVDLLGQANAEAINGRQVSAAGGLVDFIRGARLSPGGRAILALPSTARGGTVSRIVPRLEGGIVSVARGDIDLVVTEHGVADLRYRSLSGRAEALIAIAAPPLRPALQTAWEALLRAM
jgi:acyl-CoA hydrolase